MQPEDIKRLKEEFVSNLLGTSKWEIFCVVSCLPLCILIAAYAEAWVQARGRASGKALAKLTRIPKFAYEYSIIVIPQILLLMSFAPAEPAFLLLFLLWGSLALKLWMKLAHSPGSKQHMLHLLNHLSSPRKRFVSVFRGGLMLTTCLSILAVDFSAFPRRYAKAESYGAGVMDIGVGAIVWAGGLVSEAAAAAAGCAGQATSADNTAASAGGYSSRSSLYLQRSIKGFRAAIPLLLLGGGRLVATAAVGYQHHLGEYGLHWNFFWTIAVVNIATLAVPVPPSFLAAVGLSVTAVHQALLMVDVGLTSSGSLSSWMTADLSEQQRAESRFLVANKEGLGSLPGYWALHLLGAAAGRYLAVSCAAAVDGARSWLIPGAGGGQHQKQHHGSVATSVTECARVIWSWVGCCLLLDGSVWGLMMAAETWLEPVSRRLCNLPYVLWVTAQCLAWLLLCLITDILTTGLSGSSSSAPSTLLSSRILAAGFMSAATGAAAAGGVTQHAGSAATTVAGSGAKSRPGARRSIGGQPAMAAAAGGDAAADGTCAVSNAASGAGAAAVRGASSAPSSPLVKKRSAAAGGVTPGLGLLVQPAARGEATAAVPGTGSTSCGSTTSSSTTSSGGSSSPERHRKQLQQQQHDGSPSSSNRSAVVSARSSSSNSGSPMRLMLSFNRNMLVLFLLGNLLTGGLNLSVNTLAVGNWTARVIVGVYMLVLCAVAVRLDRAGITLKPR